MGKTARERNLLRRQVEQLLGIAVAAKEDGATRRSYDVDYIIRLAEEMLSYMDNAVQSVFDDGQHSVKVGRALDDDALEGMAGDLDLPDDPDAMPWAVATVVGAISTTDGSRAGVGVITLTNDGQQQVFRVGLRGVRILVDALTEAGGAAALAQLRGLLGQQLDGDDD